MIVLPFEKNVVELLERLRVLQASALENPALQPEADALSAEADRVSRETFGALSPLQKVQISRHAGRPYTLDYIERLCTDFIELRGDRRFADDASIVAGLARFRGRRVVLVGHQKGRGTKDNMRRNFGMPHPEGYRKAIRIYELAERFGLPVLTFIDTPGAYPGIGAEERGQSEAIGGCLATLARLRVPVVASIIGEGGSGGALALGVANRVMVLEFGCYSVISPEGCAAILWKDGSQAGEAALRLKITSADLLDLGVVDEIISEPTGGAHQDYDRAACLLGDAIERRLNELSELSPDALADDRYRRFRNLGSYEELS